MPPRHVCPLCGFAREAEHATVLDPACPTCGAVLELARPAAEENAGVPMAHLARTHWFERSVVGIVLLPLLLAATKVGWSAAGVAGGLGALLLAALMSYVALAPATRHH
jgi:hypothetical protein